MMLPLERIAEILDSARREAPSDVRSVHWDVFPADYGAAVREASYWPYFLRNALSYGFNDSLNFSNEAKKLMSARGDPDAVHADIDPVRRIRGDHDYRPLLAERLSLAENRGQMEKIRQIFTKVVRLCGADFVLANLAPPVGSPSVTELTFSFDEGAERTVSVNYHDLYLVYYARLLTHVAGPALDEHAGRVVEIGAGYGGLAAKLKDLYPKSAFILFDLPEVNAVQAYYLSRRFPDAEIRLYDDFQASGAGIFRDPDVDFIVLPCWTIAALPDDSIDLAINIRSMMEMRGETIAAYFGHVHRTVRTGGLFACINRYVKEPGPIRFKDYPYDARWRILLSQPSPLQGHIHELITQRTAETHRRTVADSLRALPPP